MIKLLQSFVLFLDLAILFCLLCAFVLLIAALVQQIYIRTKCRYKGFREKPGRACVICEHHSQCERAWKSESYEQYFHCRITSPDQAKKLFDEIWREEQAGTERSK